MNPAYHIYEQIDRYLKNEMEASELTEFNSKIAIDDELRELVEAQKIANSVIIDDQLFKLKQRIASDLNNGKGNSSSANWPRIIGIASLMVLTASFIIYKMKYSSEANTFVSEANQLSSVNNLKAAKSEQKVAITISKSNYSANVSSTKDEVIAEPESKLFSEINSTDKTFSSVPEENVSTYEIDMDAPLVTPDLAYKISKADCGVVKISADTKVYYDASASQATLIIDKLSVKGGTEPYSFALNEETFTASNVFGYLNDGTYSIKIKDNNNCISVLPENIVIKIPAKEIDDVFAPGRDEKWRFPVDKNANAMIKIIDKSGTTVYSASIVSGYPEEWDGRTSNGNELNAGNYYFTIQFSDNQLLKGHITIVK